MILSRLQPDLRHRQARRDLADPYQVHRILSHAVSDALTDDRDRPLWRLDLRRDGHIQHLLVQTLTEPDWSFLPPDYLLEPAVHKQLQLTPNAGQSYRFRLRANPTVKRGGKRHALYTPDERLRWLERKGEQSGFLPRTVMLAGEERVLARKNGHTITLVAVTFEGTLEIRDPERFLSSVERGIGSAKGLGMGLLSVGLR